MSGLARMPWGKYRGTPIGDIDSDYLDWVITRAEACRPWLRSAIEAELEARSQSPPFPPPRRRCPDPGLAAEAVQAGIRALAKRHHPDLGGDTRTMQRVNSVAEWLRSQVPQ